MPLRILTAGESHGPLLTTILEGMPAGIPLTPDLINVDLARRQVGYGSGARMQIERDEVRITSGVMNGQTTGGPISLIVENRDFKSWREKDIAAMPIPRPGHADLTGAIKYGYRDLRISLERASARETTMRVAAGAVCRQFLAQFGIQIGGYVTQIGNVMASPDPNQPYPERFIQAESNDVRCPDPVATEQMHAAVYQVKQDGDTLGGVMEIVGLNVPPGLGSHVHYDRRLDARLVAAMVSIQAMKGAEVGSAFEQAGWRGSEVHDDLFVDEAGNITRHTNRAGGLEGGITTGDPIIVRVAMKPIATMVRGAKSVNLATGEAADTKYERSDYCALPRAIPIGESMMAFVLTDVLMEKLGGDSIQEMKPRFDALPRSRVSDVPMNNVSWRFGYV